MSSQLDKYNFYKEIIEMAHFMHPNIVRVFGSVDKGVCTHYTHIPHDKVCR